MGQDVEGMGLGERAICLSLFVCLAVAVFTTVGLIYLTSIVYIPIKRELNAGFETTPVMCTSILNDTVACTKNVSCFEWCMADPGRLCAQIYAEVRQNGTNAIFTDCQNMFDLTCLTMKDPPANQTWNCKDIDNYPCGSMDQVFQCDNGLCVNWTSVYKCRIDRPTATTAIYDCNNRKNCITLSGLLYCQKGICHQIPEPYDCQRVCDGIEIGGGGGGGGDVEPRNLVLLAGDRVVTAHCRYGEYSDMAQTVWDTDYTHSHVLLASCTELSLTNHSILAMDCINGSALPASDLPQQTNLTGLQEIMLNKGYQNKLDPTNTTFPFDIDILIIEKAKLRVNHGGCVNTLNEECKHWIEFHGRDGKNHTAKARYPCYFMANNTEFVVTRHDVEIIEELLWFLLAVPLAIWCASCSCVVFISCCIKIDDWGHFRFSVLSRMSTTPGKAENPRNAWVEDKNAKIEDFELEKLLVQDKQLKFDINRMED